MVSNHVLTEVRVTISPPVEVSRGSGLGVKYDDVVALRNAIQTQFFVEALTSDRAVDGKEINLHVHTILKTFANSTHSGNLQP